MARADWRSARVTKRQIAQTNLTISQDDLDKKETPVSSQPKWEYEDSYVKGFAWVNYKCKSSLKKLS